VNLLLLPFKIVAARFVMHCELNHSIGYHYIDVIM